MLFASSYSSFCSPLPSNFISTYLLLWLFSQLFVFVTMLTLSFLCAANIPTNNNILQLLSLNPFCVCVCYVVKLRWKIVTFSTPRLHASFLGCQIFLNKTKTIIFPPKNVKWEINDREPWMIKVLQINKRQSMCLFTALNVRESVHLVLHEMRFNFPSHAHHYSTKEIRCGISNQFTSHCCVFSAKILQQFFYFSIFNAIHHIAMRE